MSIKSDKDLAHLQTIGRIVRKALDAMAVAVRPGITTAELNAIGSRVLSSEGARSAPPVIYGYPAPAATALIHAAESAFRAGAKAARAGARVYDIGRAVERDVKSRGFNVLRELCGHGVGRTIHEEPSVPNYHDPRLRSRLTNGLVITIEPIISAGSGTCALQPDKWTIATGDRALAAHYEHTVVITRGAPILVTAAA